MVCTNILYYHTQPSLWYMYPLLLDRKVLKSVNLKYNMLGCLDDGTNKSSTKCIILLIDGFLDESSNSPFTYYHYIPKNYDEKKTFHRPQDDSNLQEKKKTFL